MDFSRWLKCQWDRAAAMVAAVLGLVALLLGWLGVSRSSLPSQQIPYLASGAVLGLFALGVAATLWLSADLRDEWRKLDDIYQSMRPGADDAVEQPGPTVRTAPDEARADNGATQLPSPVAAESEAARPFRVRADADGEGASGRPARRPLRARPPEQRLDDDR